MDTDRHPNKNAAARFITKKILENHFLSDLWIPAVFSPGQHCWPCIDISATGKALSGPRSKPRTSDGLCHHDTQGLKWSARQPQAVTDFSFIVWLCVLHWILSLNCTSLVFYDLTLSLSSCRKKSNKCTQCMKSISTLFLFGNNCVCLGFLAAASLVSCSTAIHTWSGLCETWFTVTMQFNKSVVCHSIYQLLAEVPPQEGRWIFTGLWRLLWRNLFTMQRPGVFAAYVFMYIVVDVFA